MSEREIWTYYISRDSTPLGLSNTVDVWWAHPKRVVQDGCVKWVPLHMNLQKGGHMQTMGAQYLKDTEHIAIPETDRELIVVERWASEQKSLAESKPKQPKKKKMDYHK